MNQIIHDVSTRLENLLPEDQHFYTSDDLRALGIPDYIVDRIHCDVVRLLHKTLGSPGSDWLDDQDPNVQHAWHDFLAHIKPVARLPRHHAAEIIDNAVIDVVEMLCTPRRRTLEVVFGMDHHVSFDHLLNRSEWITVNQHLTEALIRYMERKELSELSRMDAERIIKIVDERYVEGFTPLAWAQSLDELFQLAGNKVEKELIIDYFIDKDRDDLAALFQNYSGTIERSFFIERIALGSVEELFHPIEEQQAPLEEPISEPQPQPQPEPQPEPHASRLTPHSTEPEPHASRLTPHSTEPEPHASRLTPHSPQPQPELPLHEVLEKSSTPAVPIWQQFLQEADVQLNDIDTGLDEAYVDAIEEDFVEADITISVPDPVEPESPGKNVASLGQQKIALVDWLKAEEFDFIESIFLGNQLMYFRSVSSIEACENWSEAQVFIKESIIDLMDLDYEDPVLIQFIDQIQSYFTTTVS